VCCSICNDPLWEPHGRGINEFQKWSEKDQAQDGDLEEQGKGECTPLLQEYKTVLFDEKADRGVHPEKGAFSPGGSRDPTDEKFVSASPDAPRGWETVCRVLARTFICRGREVAHVLWVLGGSIVMFSPLVLSRLWS